MTPAERRALLGDDVIAHAHQVAADAPEPPDETVAALRRIFSQPHGAASVGTTPASNAA